MTYYILRISTHFLSFIPLPIGRFIGIVFGRSIKFMNIKRFQISLNNMRQCSLYRYGDKVIKKIDAKVFEHFGQMFFELPHIFRIDQNNLFNYVNFEGEENMYRALSRGKGVFLLSAHLGNWEMMASAIPLRFGPTAVIASHVRYPPLSRFMSELRSRFGMQIIPKLNGMRKIIAALKQKKIIGVLLDQNEHRDKRHFVDFLGRKASVNSALAHVALKLDIPVVPAFCTRQKDGMYKVNIMEAVKLIRTGNMAEDIESNTALFTSIIEKQVLEYPEQWLWFHGRWKTRPKNQVALKEKLNADSFC